MLDTNIRIYLMKNQPEQVARRFAGCYVGDVVMSAITFAELDYGVSASDDPERERANLDALSRLITVEPFDAFAAPAYGPVRMATRERKRDHLDKLIASHAIALNTVLVTNNLRDFVTYPGLTAENWLEAIPKSWRNRAESRARPFQQSHR
ncbi:type II toxin-antitoxin system VapC family toxin [Neorhizobium sp. P12A]|jgi:tRNA(fMet)-specific endonuclease VapC|uniref:type II toxin-antitoxin system VapC family toxin n=1 Tax=Neorhizobium sp. P12A TaxID=2268027 RepID=UPI001FED5289|nr:type II toxin-antitoxin system VapC family toxin [Neorhizobium sp. P12A]